MRGIDLVTKTTALLIATAVIALAVTYCARTSPTPIPTPRMS